MATPAVETAAVALLTGYADPLSLLAAGREDYNLAVAVIEKARDLQRDRDKQLADYTAVKTAQQLIPGLSRVVLRAIARAMS